MSQGCRASRSCTANMPAALECARYVRVIPPSCLVDSQPTAVGATARSATASSPRTSTDGARPAGGFSDYDTLFTHDWAPAPGQRGPDTYADLAAAKADAEERKRQREARIALEQREAEMERREREIKRKQDMAALEARRQREQLEEQERRRLAKEEAKRGKNQPKRPKFDFQKEKPQIMVAVATALQAANNLVNSCRVSAASCRDCIGNFGPIADSASILTERSRMSPRAPRSRRISTRPSWRDERLSDTSSW